MISKNNYKSIFIIGVVAVGGLLTWFKTQDTQSNEIAPIELQESESSLKGEDSASLEANQVETNQQDFIASEDEQSELSVQDQQKLQIISENMIKQNDNDVRVDKELKELSPQLRYQIKNLYGQTKMENRNGRGFLAFLVARDLKSASDVDFLKSVFEEKPCMGMQDCGQHLETDPHIDSINQTSLDYPQLVILYQIESKMKSQPEMLKQAAYYDEILALLREAAQFPSQQVARKAEELLEKLGITR